MLLGSLAVLLGATCMAASVKPSPGLEFQLERTKAVLFELESAYNWRTQPLVNSSDVGAVAELVRGLDQETLDQVDQSDDRLVKALFNAVNAHSDQSEGLSWSERCNQHCTDEVIKEFMDERQTLISFFEDYKKLSNSFATQLVHKLLEKPNTGVLGETTINMAFLEYNSHLNLHKTFGDGSPLSSYLSSIDEAAFYVNREHGRLLGAMLGTYENMNNLPAFANNFKDHFYNMLHANGFGVYNHDIIKVERNFGKFV